MRGRLRTLPIGTYHFEKLRRMDCVYVDKTARLTELVEAGAWYFLSRPRRFGKSLTLSTLDAMFGGRAELFAGLAAEAWVTEQAKHPCPVLRLDMSMMDVRDVPKFEASLMADLARRGEYAGVQVRSTLPGGALQDVIIGLHKAGGPVVVLIDEYDKPFFGSFCRNNGGNHIGFCLSEKKKSSFYNVAISAPVFLDYSSFFVSGSLR